MKTLSVNPNVEQTFQNRYVQPGEKTIQDVIRRVVKFVASAEKNYGWTNEQIKELEDNYFDTINQRLWIPSSPFLMNAGTKVPMLSACFALPIDDNMESIMNTLKDAAIVQKMGGGTGFNFSKLRAEGEHIGSTGGTSSGVLSFMDIFNQMGTTIKQGGRRRSANIGILHISHPEVEKYIEYKNDHTKLTNFNISILIDDKFMKAVLNDEEYNLVSPKTKDVIKTVKAKELWNKIIENNWKSAEPGFLFIDNMNKNNPTKNNLGLIDCVNPCGEIQLYPNEACNLASINLDEFVEDGKILWDNLEYVTELVTRFLDSAIDVNQLPTQSIQEGVNKTRKLGLGIMGLHGFLIKLGLTYSSPKGREKAKEVMQFIAEVSHKYSEQLAEEKGICEGWKGSEFEKQGIKRRNIATNTIAPTGTISMLIDSSSSGCEPIYALAYYRRTEDEIYQWVNPLFKEIGEQEGWLTEEVIEKIANNNGSAKGIKEIPQKWQELFEVAMEITPEQHVLMQAELQKYVDNSISKTINLPENATIEDISNAYILGWKQGLKGMTVYRDNCRDKQVLNLTVSKTEEETVELPRGYILDTPDDLIGKRRKVQTGCGPLYIKAFYDEYTGEILETFLSKGSTGGCERYMQFTSRLISRLLRIGDTPEGIADQANSVGSCPSWMYSVGKGKLLSKGKNCPSAIANALLDLQKEIQNDLGLDELPKFSKDVKVTYVNENVCPECGAKMQTLSGCIQCVCGYSKCD